MAISPGSKLGPYEITAPIGAGGMGEVYRARDTKLDREVAMKVLPEKFAEDGERLARFEREATLLASLNHPNIATLYALEEIDGRRLLIMELVEGKTLEEIGKLSIEDALPLFEQLADGLAAAHDQGVLHRDLKPANVKVSPDDKVKILDFGLAKAFGDEAAWAGVDSSASPTRTKDTALGTVIGTAPYMSPEQARGKPVDKRTDVWAYGCCLYETLSGQKTFRGETVTDTLAAIMKSEPDLSRIPARARPLIERCLTKDVSKRLRDVGDAQLLLHESEREPSSPPRKKWTLALAAAGIAAVFFGLGNALRSPVTGREPSHLSITVPVGHKVHRGLIRQPGTLAVSPDGKTIVYVGVASGVQQLYSRRLDDPIPNALAGTEGAVGPFFSPDGEWVGFYAARSLRKVRLSGGPVTTICPLSRTPRGMSWGADGNIVFSPTRRSPLFTVSDQGGEPRALTTLNPEADELGHLWPQIIDGGTLYSVERPSGWSLAFLPAKTALSRTILESRGRYGRYLPSGHLVYTDTAGTLYATAWNPHRDTAASAGVPVVKDVRFLGAGGGFSFDVSQQGTLVYAGKLGGGDLVWVDRDGRFDPLRKFARNTPRLSPDGSRLAFAGSRPDPGIFVLDIERGVSNRISDGISVGNWHPRNETIAIMQLRSDDVETTYMVRADGSGEPTSLLGDFADRNNPKAFSPDGRYLMFHSRNEETGADLWTTTLDGHAEPFLVTPFNEAAATFSPDGRYVAYASDESGRWEVYVRDFPDGAQEWIVSSDGGREPRWSASGEIFYRDGDRLMGVDVSTEPEFRAGRPEFLLEGAFRTGAPVTADFDVTADGQRFIMILEDPVERRRIHVILNWFEELERLVPTQ